MGGDFSCVLNPVLDRSRAGPKTNLSKSGEVPLSFLNDYGLRDPWRSLSPSTRQYSFHSPVHKSYSRIEYFLVDDGSLSLVKHSKYYSIFISDHWPLQLDLHITNNSTRQRTWHFDPLLLADKDFANFISNQIDSFFKINTTPDISYSTIWKALKAYIRWQIISYSVYLQSMWNLQLTNLSRQMKDLDCRAASDPSDSKLRKERLLLQSE